MMKSRSAFGKIIVTFLRDSTLADRLGRLARKIVRRGKSTLIQWEEGNPPGNCCSSRKQSERGCWQRHNTRPLMSKVPPGGISEHADHNENEHRASPEKGNVNAESVILR
jgi:hypothetical protein